MEKNEKFNLLEDINDRVAVARAAEADLRYAVVRAVLAGCSWTEVGTMLDVSKQTAHNRYKEDVGAFERFENGESAVPPEIVQDTLNALFNPEPQTAYNSNRNWDWKRQETTPNSAPKDSNGRYSCSCGWTVSWPEHDADGAYDDIEEHERTAHDGKPQREHYEDEHGPDTATAFSAEQPFSGPLAP